MQMRKQRRLQDVITITLSTKEDYEWMEDAMRQYSYSKGATLEGQWAINIRQQLQGLKQSIAS